MATLTERLSASAYATIANADAALDTWIGVADARFQVIAGGDLCTRAYGTLGMNTVGENAGGDTYTYRSSINFDTGTEAAGAPDASVIALVTALNALLTAAIGMGAYSTQRQTDVSASITLTS